MKKAALFVLFFQLTFSLSSQNIKEVFENVSFLNEKKYHNEAISYLQYINQTGKFSTNDTIKYLVGNLHFETKNFDLAVQHFSQIQSKSLFYEESILKSALSNLYLNQPNNALKVLNNQPKNELQTLLLVGSFLLADSLSQAKKIIQESTFKNYLITNHIEQLKKTTETIESHRNKKPVTAALLSTLIPGAGKFYAGKVGEGVVSFLTTGVLTITSIEQFKNGGLNNPQFYVLAAAASVFYIGNIYGSYFSVKVAQIEFNERIKNEILFNLSVPIRSNFSK